MTRSIRSVPFTLLADLAASSCFGAGARAQSYTAPAGIPAETAPGGLMGIRGVPEVTETAALSRKGALTPHAYGASSPEAGIGTRHADVVGRHRGFPRPAVSGPVPGR